MSGQEFFQTGMGRKFYEVDVPRLIGALESCAKSLEKLANPPLPVNFTASSKSVMDGTVLSKLVDEDIDDIKKP